MLSRDEALKALEKIRSKGREQIRKENAEYIKKIKEEQQLTKKPPSTDRTDTES